MMNRLKQLFLSILLFGVCAVYASEQLDDNDMKKYKIADAAAVKQWQAENPLPISDEELGQKLSEAERAYSEQIKQRYLRHGYVPVRDFWGNEVWRNKNELELEQENRFKPYVDLSFLQKNEGFNPKGFRQNYPVIWFMDRFMCANPITSAALATGTAASILAYFYYRYNRKAEQNKQQNDESENNEDQVE